MKNIDASSWFAEPKLVIINTKDVNRRRQSEFRMQFKNLTRQKAPAAGAASASEEAEE
jgi:type IV pilus assembly protein PilN